MGAAIWSANPHTFAEIPARTFAEFFSRHGLLRVSGRPQWRTIEGGSRTYVTRLEHEIAERGKIHVATSVESIRRSESGVEVVTEGGVESFDHVVIACHSDEALAMLEHPTDDERIVLGAIRYQPNDVTLHFDESQLPRNRRAWAAWNYHQPSESRDLPTVTYWMNRLQDLQSSEQILVTLNREDEIDPAKVHGRFEYDHPIYSREGFAAQLRWDEVNGRNATWFCGAWWGYGFHEDGAASGLRVARALGAGRP